MMTAQELQQEQALRHELMTQGDGKLTHKNYFVEAGAGAGKTYILVQRITSQLLSGNYKPEELVAITFTKKATQELSSRLSRELQNRLEIEKSKGATQRDEALVSHIQNLIDQLGLMQISTIHGFCQSMLSAMPFENPLGVDWDMIESDTAGALAFFAKKAKEEPKLFSLSEDFSIPSKLLSKTFLTLTQTHFDEAVTYQLSDPEIKNILVELLALGKDVFPKIQKNFAPILQTEDKKLLTPTFRELIALQNPSDGDYLRLLALIHSGSTAPLIYYGNEVKRLKEELSRKKKDGVDADYDKAHPICPAMRDLIDFRTRVPFSTVHTAQFKRLIHAVTMNILLPLVAEYQDLQREKHQVAFNDLMVYTRDMLRDSPMARAYFSERYRAIYVDEFQDTDPLQAEILFYLCGDIDPNTPPPKWQDCPLRPGSLFLVGDPKQGIYRFRGADISIYNEVKDIFARGMQAGGNETIISLQENFRSEDTVLNFVDKVFAVGGTAPLDGGNYQADYLSMHPMKQSSPYGKILTYETLGEKNEMLENDPLQVAAFIQSMVENKVELGLSADKVKARPATYEDFLILPFEKKAVARYEAALTALGIPTIATGAQKLEEVPIIAKGLKLLHALAHPADDIAFISLLTTEYDISLTSIHRFLHLSENPYPQSLRSDDMVEKVLGLLGDSDKDKNLAKLCALCKKLIPLYAHSRTKSPMSTLELLFDGDFHLWAPKEERLQKGDYALVQNFLNTLRPKAEGSLVSLYHLAVEVSKTEIEYQLLLESQLDCVRIMNLHKAKGLEGTVVILPYSKPPKFPPSFHLERSDKIKLYQCVQTKAFRQTSTIGTAPEWDDVIVKEGRKNVVASLGKSSLEAHFLDAEKDRLRYVAATRAETMLVMSTGKDCYWESLVAAHDKNQNAGLTGDLKLAYNALQTGSSTHVSLLSKGNTKPSPVLLDTEALHKNLCTGSRYSISPSRLDAQAPRAKSTADDGETVAPTPEITIQKPEERQSYMPPYGAHWGTMVHRVLELAVKYQSFDDTSFEDFAREAIWETLGEESLSKTQSAMLFGEKEGGLSPENILWLTENIMKTTAFARDDTSPFRQLLKKGTLFPELSFFTSTHEGDLHQHLHAHLGDKEAEGKILDVQGFIDLAISTETGWIILDYKTNQKKLQEDLQNFESHLKEQYHSQLSAYGKLLTQSTGKPVLGLYLCATHIDGALVDLGL